MERNCALGGGRWAGGTPRVGACVSQPRGAGQNASVVEPRLRFQVKRGDFLHYKPGLTLPERVVMMTLVQGLHGDSNGA